MKWISFNLYPCLRSSHPIRPIKKKKGKKERTRVEACKMHDWFSMVIALILTESEYQIQHVRCRLTNLRDDYLVGLWFHQPVGYLMNSSNGLMTRLCIRFLPFMCTDKHTPLWSPIFTEYNLEKGQKGQIQRGITYKLLLKIEPSDSSWDRV